MFESISTLTSITIAAFAGPQISATHHAVCNGCAEHAEASVEYFRRPNAERGTGVVYLNDDAGMTVALGASMPPEPFANRTTAASLASVIDLDAPETADPHNQSSHVWVSGADLELDFDLGNDFDLSIMHFWNYTSGNYDVDEIDMIFFDSSMNEIGRIDDLAPATGVSSGGVIAENIPLAFPSGTRHINMWLRGSNGQVDFQNIGFTGSFTSGGEPVSIAAGPASVLLPPEGGNVAFAVSAVGTPPLAYQWRRDGVELAGEEGSTLTVNATLADVGLYDCVVTNDFGAATSDAAVLGIRPLGCNRADLAEPAGLLDLADVLSFVTAFTDGCP